MKNFLSYLVLPSLVFLFFYSCKPEPEVILPQAPICKECYSSVDTIFYCEQDFSSPAVFEAAISAWETTYTTTCVTK